MQQEPFPFLPVAGQLHDPVSQLLGQRVGRGSAIEIPANWSTLELFHFFGPKVMYAILCGGLIGIERELKNKPAGIKTNILICLGAALYTSISILMAGTYADSGHYGDPARLAAAIERFCNRKFDELGLQLPLPGIAQAPELPRHTVEIQLYTVPVVSVTVLPDTGLVWAPARALAGDAREDRLQWGVPFSSIM